MTETLPSTGTAPPATVRPYRPADHGACRRLWVELTAHRNRLYGRPVQAERDAGGGFEEYLTRLDLSGMWVADHVAEGVIGFVGLILDNRVGPEGRVGKLDPIVVTEAMRGHGIGRALLSRVSDEARRRGLSRLTVSPPARDAAALTSLYHAGFVNISSVTVNLDLRDGMDGRGSDRINLYDLGFSA